MTQNERPEKEPEIQQIGEYTVTSTSRCLEIRHENTTFAFTPTEVWDLFDLLHDQIAATYERLREVGLGAYPASKGSIHEACCCYIREGYLRRCELIPGPRHALGESTSFIQDFLDMMRFEEERRRDQREGWPLWPEDPITENWTRVNDTLILCASQIASRYGTRQAQSSNRWLVLVDYSFLAEIEIAIQLGFWRLDHPEGTDQELEQARQEAKEVLGLRQGIVIYKPEEFLVQASNWHQATQRPMILEYDASNRNPVYSDRGPVIAKLYPGGHLRPCAFVYREEAE